MAKNILDGLRKHKYHILLVLFAISFISSSLLSFVPLSAICNPEHGCDVVQSSVYASTLGITNSHFGVVLYFVMAFLTFSHIINPKKIKRKIIYLGTFIASLVAIYFIYLQEFVIGAYCQYCMIVDISTLLALFLIILTWKN